MLKRVQHDNEGVFIFRHFIPLNDDLDGTLRSGAAGDPLPNRFSDPARPYGCGSHCLEYCHTQRESLAHGACSSAANPCFSDPAHAKWIWEESLPFRSDSSARRRHPLACDEDIQRPGLKGSSSVRPSSPRQEDSDRVIQFDAPRSLGHDVCRSLGGDHRSGAVDPSFIDNQQLAGQVFFAGEDPQAG